MLPRKITEASRAIDHLLTGREDVSDYLKLETITDEILSGERNPLVDSAAHLVCWPHKPIITAVTALSVRFSPLETWRAVDLNAVTIEGGRKLEVWQMYGRGRAMVKISFSCIRASLFSAGLIWQY